MGLWFLLIAVLALGLMMVVIVFFTNRATTEIREMGADIAARFEATFNVSPEVRVDGLVIIQAKTPVLELATASRSLVVRHRWTHTHLYSTKVLEIEAPFTAKAGFNLEEPFRIRIDPHTKIVSTDLPKPQILSTEMGDLKILRDEDGLWNKLTAEDREEAFRALREQAKKQFDETALLNEARLEVETRIRQLLDPTSQPPEPLP
ncbi:MAG: DUF4230 domain-containing protein [Terrimicrobiaceae bacterium]